MVRCMILGNVGEFFKDFPQAILFITYRYFFCNHLCFSSVPNRMAVLQQFMTVVTCNEAQQVCESLNSNPTSIHSAAECDFILGQVRSSDTKEFWIGFTDRANEGSFEWVDGSDVTYTNWIEGQPDDFGSNQDCGIALLTWGSRWDDANCRSSSTSRYICRKDINWLTNSAISLHRRLYLTSNSNFTKQR